MENKDKNNHSTATTPFSEKTDPASGMDNARDIEEGKHTADDHREQSARKRKISRAKSQTEKEVDIEALQNELTEANQKASEYFEGWQRERADFSNYRKRIERDQNDINMVAMANFIKKYLVILDDLELALKSRPEQNADPGWVDGIELIYRKLKNFLEVEGVKPIPETKEFDPNLHEAITHEENPDYQNGEIIEIVQQGYTLGDRILRPARVRVAK